MGRLDAVEGREVTGLRLVLTAWYEVDPDVREGVFVIAVVLGFYLGVGLSWLMQ